MASEHSTPASTAPGDVFATTHWTVVLAAGRRHTPQSDHALEEARHDLDRWYRALERTPALAADTVPEPVLEALCDDLNTPLAIARLHALADAALAGDTQASAGLLAAGSVLGLLQQDPSAWFRGGLDAAAIEARLAARRAARQARDFALADAIRAELESEGILVEDNPSGTSWRRA